MAAVSFGLESRRRLMGSQNCRARAGSCIERAAAAMRVAGQSHPQAAWGAPPGKLSESSHRDRRPTKRALQLGPDRVGAAATVRRTIRMSSPNGGSERPDRGQFLLRRVTRRVQHRLSSVRSGEMRRILVARARSISGKRDHPQELLGECRDDASPHKMSAAAGATAATSSSGAPFSLACQKPPTHPHILHPRWHRTCVHRRLRVTTSRPGPGVLTWRFTAAIDGGPSPASGGGGDRRDAWAVSRPGKARPRRHG